MKFKILLLAIVMSSFGEIISQDVAIEKCRYATKLILGTEIPSIDGKIDDQVWNQVDWDCNFVQHRPNNGVAPSQQTKFKILYDENFIYVAFRCYDTSPDSIVKRLSRRDGFEGDWIGINFDSFHDLRSCYAFYVTAAGVKGDEFLSNDGGSSDDSYNPIWFTKTNVDSEGWTAEMKIPMSQLRFVEAENQVWGLQLVRKLFRKEERITWQKTPLDAAGWVSTFGELHGLQNLKPKRQIEIQPYVLAKADRYPKVEGNPFRSGKNASANFGLDGKVGISNALTLDFTINPDFGQVEADPASLTLDGFQIFFREQRPFFVENRNIFSFSVSPSEAGNTFYNDNLFYSRRIGKNPSGYPSLNGGEYASAPLNTTILGAAKVSGRTSNGWSLGILETVTDREYAEIDLNGERRDEIVEPLTNYFVARAQKDYNNANTSIGGIMTSTVRKIEGNLDFLHSSATTGGLDFQHRWKQKSWYVAGDVIASHVEGTKESIMGTQQSMRHLFQREGADHVAIDTTATSLTGTAGNLKIGKVGNGNLMFEGGVTWRSPELELNDLGFMRQADDIRHYFWSGYRWRKPFSIFNNAALNYNHWVIYDFEGNLNSAALNLNTSGNFKNFWAAGCGTNIVPYQFSNSVLRGGPRFRQIPSVNGWVWFQSADRKKIQIGGNGSYQASRDKAGEFLYSSLWMRYQPINALSITLDAGYNTGFNELQYVTTRTYNEKTDYIQARIDQEEIYASLRLNLTINPTLTIQYYGQPYISKGSYTNFKTVNDPLTAVYSEKVNKFSTGEITAHHISYSNESEQYSVDENGNGISDYSFGNPDYTFFQFRSNLVLRWEYRPGSELYLVWSQGNVQFGNDDRQTFNYLTEELTQNKNKGNTLLLKATFRLGL